MVVDIDITANCCFTRDCCTRKTQKETETEETIGFVSLFFSLEAFQLGGGTLGLPGYAYGFVITEEVFSHTNYKIWRNQTAKEHLLQ